MPLWSQIRGMCTKVSGHIYKYSLWFYLASSVKKTKKDLALATRIQSRNIHCNFNIILKVIRFQIELK